LFAPVLPGVEHDKQRETATDRRKNTPARDTFASSRCGTGTTGCTRTTTWPIRTSSCAQRTAQPGGPDARGRRERRSSRRSTYRRRPDDRSHLAVVGEDRELIRRSGCSTWQRSRAHARCGDEHNNETPLFSPDGKTLAVVRSTRSKSKAMRPTLTLIDTAGGSLREIGSAFDAWPQPATGPLMPEACLYGGPGRPRASVRHRHAEREGRAHHVARSAGSHSDISVLKDGRVVGIRSTFREPPEAFAVTLQLDSPPQTLAGCRASVSRLGRGRALQHAVDRRHAHPVLRDTARQGRRQVADAAVDPRRPIGMSSDACTGAGIRCWQCAG